MTVPAKGRQYFVIIFSLLTMAILWFALRTDSRWPRPNNPAHGSDPPSTERVLLPPIGKKDEDWLSLAFAGYQGPSFRLTVGKIQQRVGLATQHGIKASHTAGRLNSAAESFLRSALDNLYLFDVVELEEKQITGMAARSSLPPKTEGSTSRPVEHLLLAFINDWTFSGTQSHAESTGQAKVEMSFRILDLSTNFVLFSTVEQAEITLPGFHPIRTYEAALSSEADATLRLAAQACINKGVWRVANWFKDRPWTGTVSRVQGEQVDIDAGSHRGLAEGMVLNVLSSGKQLFDPETGLAAGSVTTEIGRLRIIDVKDQTSRAITISGGDGVKPGDRVELIRHR